MNVCSSWMWWKWLASCAWVFALLVWKWLVSCVRVSALLVWKRSMHLLYLFMQALSICATGRHCATGRIGVTGRSCATGRIGVTGRSCAPGRIGVTGRSCAPGRIGVTGRNWGSKHAWRKTKLCALYGNVLLMNFDGICCNDFWLNFISSSFKCCH